MKKVPSILTLGAAVIAALAIAIGFYFNHSDEIESTQAPTTFNEIALAHQSPSASPESEEAVSSSSSINTPGGEQDAGFIGPEELAASVLLDDQSDSSRPEPEAADPVQTSVNALRQAHAAFSQRDYETCVSNLQEVAAAGDARFDVHYLLGLSLRYLERYEEAEAALADALTVAPQNVRALVNSARNLLALQRIDAAEERIQKAIDINPVDGDAWNVLGRVELAKNDLQAAIEAFSRATEIDDANAYAFNNLGFTFLQLEEWQQAAEALEMAVQLKADVAYFHNNLGVSYERLGQLGKSAQAYAEAVRLQPEHTKAQISLARVTPLVEQQESMAASADPVESEIDTTEVTESDVETVAVKPE